MAENSAREVQDKNSSYFVEWIPRNINVQGSSPPGLKLGSKEIETTPTVSVLALSTALKLWPESLRDKILHATKRQPYFHHLAAEDIERSEIAEAIETVNSITYDYTLYNDTCCCGGHGFEDEEEGEGG